MIDIRMEEWDDDDRAKLIRMEKAFEDFQNLIRSEGDLPLPAVKPSPILTSEGIRLPTGELITEGRVLNTLREALRLLDAGDKIGFLEMVDVDKYEREGWSEDELYMFASTYFENGSDLINEVDKIGETEEFKVYWESKKNKDKTS